MLSTRRKKRGTEADRAPIESVARHAAPGDDVHVAQRKIKLWRERNIVVVLCMLVGVGAGAAGAAVVVLLG